MYYCIIELKKSDSSSFYSNRILANIQNLIPVTVVRPQPSIHLSVGSEHQCGITENTMPNIRSSEDTYPEMPAPRLISMHIVTLVKFPRTNFSVARLVWTIRLKNPAIGNWVPLKL